MELNNLTFVAKDKIEHTDTWHNSTYVAKDKWRTLTHDMIWRVWRRTRWSQVTYGIIWLMSPRTKWSKVTHGMIWLIWRRTMCSKLTHDIIWLIWRRTKRSKIWRMWRRTKRSKLKPHDITYVAKGEVDPTETRGNLTLWLKVQFRSVQDAIYAMRKPTLCAPPRLSDVFPTLPLKRFQFKMLFMRWENPHYALHPVSQTFSQRYLWNGSSVPKGDLT